MRITYLGQEYDLDLDKVGIDEWREAKRKYGLTPKAVQDGLDEADPDAMTFAYWVMLRQSGQPAGTLGDHLKPDIIALNNAVGTAVEAERKAQLEAEAQRAAAPDPTQVLTSPPASPSPPAAPSPPSPAAQEEVSPPPTGP
jgi:hypothetical protein